MTALCVELGNRICLIFFTYYLLVVNNVINNFESNAELILFLRNEENEAVTSSFSKLSVLSDLRGLVASACDCSFVYWVRLEPQHSMQEDLFLKVELN